MLSVRAAGYKIQEYTHTDYVSSGLTPARPLLDHHQARFARRLLAQPQGGGRPEGILGGDSGATVSRLRAASGVKPGETVEPQVWSEDRTSPGQCVILEGGLALDNARNWYVNAWETIWTDGSGLEDGRVGAACAWRTREGSWEGRRFHLEDNKEVFDAEVFAIYQALRVFESRGRSGRRFAVFSDYHPAIQRAGSGVLGPGQCWARAITEVASRLVASGNEVAIY